MWCRHCQAEVAGEATQDNMHVICAACGQQITTTRSLPNEVEPITKDPKELLARWASDEILDPYGPVLGKGASTDTGDSMTDISSTAANEIPTEKIASFEGHLGMTRTLPLTTGELMASTPQHSEPEQIEIPVIQELSEEQPEIEENIRDEDPQDFISPVESVADAPSALLTTAESSVASPKKRRGGGMMFLGQILAFVGVFSLTIGTTFVLWGYYREIANYAPMGWLVATAGQMLLFLGVVTLVSGGMEQTTSAVEMKIDALSERILRIEHQSSQSPFSQPPLAVESQLNLPAQHVSPPEAAA